MNRDKLLQTIETVKLRCQQALEEMPSREDNVGFIASVHEAIDQSCKQADAEHGTVACGMGCAWCCQTRVQASPVEILWIAAWIHVNQPDRIPSLIETLQKRVTANTGKFAWRDREPCALLHEKLCTVYQVRPSTCRKAHSMEVKACESFSDQIPSQVERVLHAEILISGSNQAYTALGYESEPVDLNEGLLKVLSQPEVLDLWLAKQAAFSGSI